MNEINVSVKGEKGKLVSPQDRITIIDTIMELKNKLGYRVQIDFKK